MTKISSRLQPPAHTSARKGVGFKARLMRESSGISTQKRRWLDTVTRKNQIAALRTPEADAYYGYEKIPQKNKSDWVRRHFNTVAGKYDMMNTVLSFGIHHAWKRTAVRAMKIHPGDFVLDVAGGTGDLSLLAKQKTGDKGSVVLFDINRAMIESGRRKTSRGTLRKQLHYVQGDVESLPFATDGFDKVMVGFGIRNVTRYEKGFREMFRVLKPGGAFMCLEFSKPETVWFRMLYDVYSFQVIPVLGSIFAGTRKAYAHLAESIRTFPMPDELSDMLREIGFTRVRYRCLTDGIAVIHSARKREDGFS